MKAAFRFLSTRPAPSARIVESTPSGRAGRATDRQISSLRERMAGETVAIHVERDVLRRETRKRFDLETAFGHFEGLDVGAQSAVEPFAS